ncbi:DUF2007 domain-containing protein [Corallococcus sp. 4LFB]|uniref:putative signal transducing protein n=1 Tax=Corallococcus sp. 4LFB TaxID=3383249 RepID=UPI003976A4AC
MGIPDHDFRLLTTCGDSSEAALLRGLLEANSIPCIVQGEQHRSMLGVAGAYIEVRVLVLAGELERARELLTSVPQEEPPGNGAAATPDPDSEEAHCAVHGQRATLTCKRCGNFLCGHCDAASAGLYRGLRRPQGFGRPGSARPEAKGRRVVDPALHVRPPPPDHPVEPPVRAAALKPS